MSRLATLALIAATAPQIASAIEVTSTIENFVSSNILTWVEDAAVVSAIAAQNEMTAGYDAAQIDALDLQWRAEVGTASDLVDGVLLNQTSDFLRSQVAASDGRITEIILMDAQGLNVAASDATSDYWQGDEAKHQETYGVGPDAVHYGEIEFDESSQTYQAQISMTISDPATGAPIGAVTVGVDAEFLM